MAHPPKLHLVPGPAPANPRDELDAALNAVARVKLIQGMRRKGWTVEQLARESAADDSTVCRWLSGESRVPGKALVAVGAVGNENGDERAA